MRKIVCAALFSAAFVAAQPAIAATVTSDFSFGSGTPFAGTTTLGGVDVTLTTTVTEPFGTTSFRDTVTDEDATVQFSFSDNISEFSLTLVRVRNDEFIKDFNIGLPTSITGDLALTASGISTLNGGDFNTGTVIWTGIDTNVISFTVSTASGAALAFSEFGLTAAPTTIPLPAGGPLLLAGLGLLGLSCSRRRAGKAPSTAGRA